MPSAFPYCSIFFLFLNSVASFQIPRFLAESEKNMPKCHWIFAKEIGMIPTISKWLDSAGLSHRDIFEVLRQNQQIGISQVIFDFSC